MASCNVSDYIRHLATSSTASGLLSSFVVAAIPSASFAGSVETVLGDCERMLEIRWARGDGAASKAIFRNHGLLM